MNNISKLMIVLAIIIAVFSQYDAPIVEKEECIQLINPNIGGKTTIELIKNECERQNVDEKLVYAIINSELPSADTTVYGIMKMNSKLVTKYNVNWSDGCGVVESVEANVVAGIGRLKWCMENNQSVEGALMVYIYTKPQAQEMWAKSIKTTEWVEAVKELMK